MLKILYSDEMSSSSEIKVKIESSIPKIIKIEKEKYKERFIKYLLKVLIINQ